MTKPISLPRCLMALAAAILPTVTMAGANFEETIARPLHYRPDGDTFVVENGREFFNRPLYGLNTPFRVDVGDLPEFSLYLPGRGGNLRLGMKTAKGSKWFLAADKVVARYGDAMMRYEIRDPLLGDGSITLAVAAMNATEGLIVRVDLTDTTEACELVWAYGGANGATGSRGGDIGAEREPVSKFFQLDPPDCAGSKFEMVAPGFLLHRDTTEIVGIMPEGAKGGIADANHWASVDDLLASADKPETPTPVVVGRVNIEPGKSQYLALQRSKPTKETKTNFSYLLPTYKTDALPHVFEEAAQYWQTLARRVTVKTPDAFINAAMPALCVAADGVWDSNSKAFMHGAVAWRTKLFGWRGGYSGDALGWHDRTRSHLMNWFPKQNAAPVDASQSGEPAIVPPDKEVRLARNEPVLHTNGDLTNTHYDMNLPGIDIFFRHLLWTGDLDFARENWPVIERHLAWERRLFRRPFGPDKLPLYEAYCCIWASDDLQYHGGGVTHSSAYNYYHNRMAARVAKLIGKDPAPYEQEADLIRKAMRRELWLADRGWFAEWKDLLGLQLTHPNAGLWTFYHTLDSEVPDPQEAWQMSRFIDTQMPHIPIKGNGVPAGGFFTLPTTTWMPYTWSTNNVVMAESAHTALAYWQAGRGDEAFRLYKGLLLDSMYQGLCPGNVGMCTAFDTARGESQRDFADGVGATSRAFIEGLFGVKPDALAAELNVRPGFPAGWNDAEIHHPDFDFAFDRKGLVEHYRVESRFAKAMALKLVVPALRDSIAGVAVNGRPAEWRVLEDSVGLPRVEIRGEAAAKSDVEITWKGEPPQSFPGFSADKIGKVEAAFGTAKVMGVVDPQKVLADSTIDGSTLRASVSGTPGHRTAFAKLSQGGMTWLAPMDVEIGAKDVSAYKMTDWARQPEMKGKWECVDLTPVLNDKVTQIFKNEYLSPRSPYCSLAIPIQGIGSWIHWDPAKDKAANASIDDTGLRAAAGKSDGRFVLPQGIPFQTAGPGDAKNIAFTSQWDNYPREVSVPVQGKAAHVYLMMAGSTNSMQSRFDNGEVIVSYADGSTERLALENPTTWWPIEQDYKIDDYAFRRPEPLPLRVDLKTGEVRLLDRATFRGKGGKVDGGSATVLDLPLRPDKDLKSLTVRALANEVVVGLMSATLLRPEDGTTPRP